MKKRTLTLLLLAVTGLLLLTACTAGMAGSWPGVSVDTDITFISYGPQVYAVRITDGTQVWRFPEKADPRKTFYAAPVLTADGQLIVGDYGNVLHSLDAQSGLERWAFTEAKGRWIGSVLVVDETIYAPNADGKLYTFDLRGNKGWQFEAKGALWAAPVTDGEKIYVGSMDHFIYALNPANGTVAWSVDVGGAVINTPALSAEGMLYLGTLNNEIVVVDTANGSIAWRSAVEGGVWSTPALLDGSIFFGDLKGNYYRMDSSDGTILWRNSIPDGSITGTPLALREDMQDPASPVTAIIFTSKNSLVKAVDMDGKAVWERPVEKIEYYAGPVWGGTDRILIPQNNTDQLLLALNGSGTPVWSFIPPK